MAKLKEACAKFQIDPYDAALRWLVHHSKLKPGDGIIIGCSTVSSLKKNVASARSEPLPAEMLPLLDEAALLAKSSWPPYHR